MLQSNLYCNTVLRQLLSCSRKHYTERKVKINNNIAINYVQSGIGERSVILMPGALGSAWTDFKPQIEQLPRLLPNHTFIAWDPPGYGNSRPPARQFNVDFYKNDAQFAVDLMRALNRPKFSIVGWSDGGITGLIVAGRFAECVEKLVIWGAGAYLNSEEVKELQAIRDVKKWSARMRDPMEKLYGAEEFEKLWAAWVDTVVRIYKECKGDICRTEVRQVKASTLILHGKKDPMIATEHIPYLRENIPGCKYYEFPEGKHNVHLRYAEEFNKVLAQFLLQKP